MPGSRIPFPYSGPITHGIDVSFYQSADVDWQRVAASGVEFAIARIGDGLGRDSTFKRHYTGARGAGIIPGAYQFMRPDLDVKAQAQIAIDALAGVQAGPFDLPVVIDMERPLDDPHATADKMLEWIAYLSDATKRTPIVYAGAAFAQFVHDDRLAAYPLWTPYYGPGDCRVPRAWAASGWTFWQTSGTGMCPGVRGHVDVDVFRGDRAALDAFRGATPNPAA